MIVTIDGPGGAGKSTAARLLAGRLGFGFLDTGAMYRAVALAGLRAGVRLDDQEAAGRLVGRLDLRLVDGRILLAGEDVTAALRTQEVTAASGIAADNPAIRRYLAERQRALAADRNIVCEGRDQGTVVFPHAGCKFFLLADLDERARRRCDELAASGKPADFGQVRQALKERDDRDRDRAIAPMTPAGDAVVIDSTGRSIDEVIGLMEEEVRRRLA